MTANIILSNVSIDVSSTANAAALEVGSGASLYLTLEGANILKSGNSRAGLQLDASANLTITEGSDGASLTANAGNQLYSGAGIGGGNATGAAGNITIAGGNITATGGGGGGIGSGTNGASVDNITISGGTITKATTSVSGAGIGGGFTNSPVTGDITISGGLIIEATGAFGAGIGGGQGYSGVTGSITISGGTITKAAADTNAGAAGIGGGQGICPVGSISITDGTITEAIGGSNGGAGIGGGLAGSDVFGAITISGGTITKAVGGNKGGAGIGAGLGYAWDDTTSAVDSITISGGTITEAVGGTSGGAGIGGSLYKSGVTNGITISGGTITATRSNSNSQDIGNGDIASNPSYATSVIIDGGTVWTTNGAVAWGSTPSIGATNSVGTSVYANTLTVGSSPVADKLITAGIIDGIDCSTTANAAGGAYGINDVTTNTSGNVCFWLPDKASGAVGLVADGSGYELGYTRSGTPGSPQILLAAPQFVSATPVGTDKALKGFVVLTFSGAMDTSSATVKLLPTPSGAPLTLSSGIWSSGDTVYTIPYEGLDGETAYKIEVSGFRTDVSGLSLPLDDTNEFTTARYTASSLPTSGDFGTVVAGYSTPPSAQQFTVTNTGTVAFTGVNAAIAGVDDTAFEVVSPGLSPTTIATSGTATVSVRPVAGLPARNAPYAATLALTNADGLDFEVDLSFTVASYSASSYPTAGSFGPIAAGYDTAPAAQQFTITNTGMADLTNVQASLVGTNATEYFTISTGLSSTTIAYQDTATISVQPKTGLAASSTPYAATLHLTGNSGFSLDISLSFRVISYSATSTPEEKDFGSVKAGYAAPTPQTFVITNDGAETLTNLSATITGSDITAFEITAFPAATVGSGGTTAIEARPVTGLSPSDRAYGAALHITGDNGLTLDIPVSFVVATFKIGPLPTGHNFGTEESGYSSPTRNFTVTNTGSGAINDLEVFLEGPDASAFNFTATLVPLGLPSLDFASLSLTPLALYGLLPTQHLAVDAYPISGLAPRDTPYTATLRITSSEGIDSSVSLSFTVKAAEGTGTGGNGGNGGGGNGGSGNGGSGSGGSGSGGSGSGGSGSGTGGSGGSGGSGSGGTGTGTGSGTGSGSDADGTGAGYGLPRTDDFSSLALLVAAAVLGLFGAATLMLTLRQGRKINDVALRTDHPERPAPGCSLDTTFR
ncbi:MAG: hypothetical protein LBL86_00685 [Coriobacteriales bacterium]|nr:hypothetical protein [Coriobacteriales bacterium]